MIVEQILTLGRVLLQSLGDRRNETSLNHFYAICPCLLCWNALAKRALDCILEPGKRVLEVGSGLGYWAYLLKLRSGDDSSVRCFDPFAPPARQRTGNMPCAPPQGSTFFFFRFWRNTAGGLERTARIPLGFSMLFDYLAAYEFRARGSVGLILACWERALWRSSVGHAIVLNSQALFPGALM